MKKLKLIIPLRKHPSSNYSKSFLVFTILFVGVTKLNAQIYGCHVVRNMEEVLYYTPYGLGSPSEWITVGIIDPSGAEGGFRIDGTATYGCIKNIGGPCTVYQQFLNSSGVVAIRIYKTGVYGGINPINCTLDDYVPLLSLFVASIGYFTLRKKQKLLKR